METVTLKRKELETIEDALMQIGVALSNSTKDYVWPTDLHKKFTKAYNILKKKR